MNMRMSIVTAAVMAAVLVPAPSAFAADGGACVEKDVAAATPPVRGEAGIKIASRQLTYSLMGGRDPVFMPRARLTFFDWAYAGVYMLCDFTNGNGRRVGYGNRGGKPKFCDSYVGLAHEFRINDSLGRLGVDFDYIYEYVPRYRGSMNDTQYFDLRLSLPDLWLEPTLWIERDFMLDGGTYVNLEIGHAFPLTCFGEGFPLVFRPSFSQGFGNLRRTRGYSLANRHAGLMDSCIKGAFEYRVSECVTLSAYALYADYWFDRRLREGARARNSLRGSGCCSSYVFVAGVGVSVAF